MASTRLLIYNQNFHAVGRFSRWNNEVFTLAGLKMLQSTVSIKDIKVLRKDYPVVYSMNRLHESLGFSSSYLLFKSILYIIEYI